MPKAEIKNNVVFNPYVGKDYERNGKKFLGKRIMVVGASHYCEHYTSAAGCSNKCPHYGNYRFHNDNKWYFGKKCERFTEIVIERYRAQFGGKGEKNWFRTFSRFYNLFFNIESRMPNHEDRMRLLDHIVHTEYLQGAEGDNPKAHNMIEMTANRNFDEFAKMVACYKPNIVFFWGPRAWEELCRCCDINDRASDIHSALIGGIKVQLARVPHPSAYGRGGLKKEHFQNQLKELGVKLVELD